MGHAEFGPSTVLRALWIIELLVFAPLGSGFSTAAFNLWLSPVILLSQRALGTVMGDTSQIIVIVIVIVVILKITIICNNIIIMIIPDAETLRSST